MYVFNLMVDLFIAHYARMSLSRCLAQYSLLAIENDIIQLHVSLVILFEWTQWAQTLIVGKKNVPLVTSYSIQMGRGLNHHPKLLCWNYVITVQCIACSGALVLHTDQKKYEFLGYHHFRANNLLCIVVTMENAT